MACRHECVSTFVAVCNTQERNIVRHRDRDISARESGISEITGHAKESGDLVVYHKHEFATDCDFATTVISSIGRYCTLKKNAVASVKSANNVATGKKCF